MLDPRLLLALAFAALTYLIGRSHVLTGREISLALKRRRAVMTLLPDDAIEVRWEVDGDEPVVTTLRSSFFERAAAKWRETRQ